MASEEQQPLPPPPVYDSPDRGKLFFILFFLMLAVVAIIVLYALPLGQEEKPEDALEKYADALNDRDVEGMFDQTVLRFSDDYQDRLAELDDQVFAFDPYLTINSSRAVYTEDMTDLQLYYSEALVAEVEDEFGVQVDDFCVLEYTYTIEYRELWFQGTYSVETVCVNMYGHWYLVLPQYL